MAVAPVGRETSNEQIHASDEAETGLALHEFAGHPKARKARGINSSSIFFELVLLPINRSPAPPGRKTCLLLIVSPRLHQTVFAASPLMRLRLGRGRLRAGGEAAGVGMSWGFLGKLGGGRGTRFWR